MFAFFSFAVTVGDTFFDKFSDKFGNVFSGSFSLFLNDLLDPFRNRNRNIYKVTSR